MRKKEKYIMNLATSIVGNNLLTFLLQKREEKMIKKGVIRQIFIHEARKAVSKMSFATLGEICAFGDKLGRDEMITTRRDNTRATILLDTSDHSEVLLEKIAVATILSAIDKLINEGKQNFNDFWTQQDLVGKFTICMEGPSEIQSLKQKMGW